MAKIVVVGSLIVDVTAFAPRFPVEGETVIGKSLKLGPGGKGNNQVTAAHRVGGEVKMISKLGDDLYKNIILDHYRSEGLSTEHIKIQAGAETGAALIEVLTGGENRIIVIKGANDGITAADVGSAEKDFADCDLFLSQHETSRESLYEGIRLAKKYRKPIILNPAPPQEMPAGAFEGIDYLTPNETEAEYYTGVKIKTAEDAEKAAETLLSMGVKNVIITMGRQGAFFMGVGQKMLVPATDLKPVDTTGAGDAFNGGFAVAVAEGMPVEQALKFANCVASISVTRKGSAPSMPHRGEVEALMKRFYGI